MFFLVIFDEQPIKVNSPHPELPVFSPCLAALGKMDDTAEWFVDLDCKDLLAFDSELYEQMIRYPQVCSFIISFMHIHARAHRHRHTDTRTDTNTQVHTKT